jgi:GxxExxY protein
MTGMTSFDAEGKRMEPACNWRGDRSSSDQRTGLIEEIYSKCLGRECELRNIPFTKEVRVPLEYKGFVFEQPLRLDFLIDEVLILELKAVEEVLPIHKAQLLSYMKLLKKPLGLLINFHELILRKGIRRMILEENALL